MSEGGLFDAAVGFLNHFLFSEGWVPERLRVFSGQSVCVEIGASSACWGKVMAYVTERSDNEFGAELRQVCHRGKSDGCPAAGRVCFLF